MGAIMPTLAKQRSLDVYRDLNLRGPASGCELLRRAILDLSVAPWRHAAEKERPAPLSKDQEVLCLEREADDELEAAGVALWRRADGYEVVNIVPLKVGQLDPVAYNAILQDFLDRIGSPAARKAGFSVETTAPRESLQDWVSPEAADALRRFSAAANKATGSAQPLDRKRWFDFLMRVHADSKRIDAGQLARWLTEVEDWTEERAHRLVEEYEFAQRLLDEYDESRH